MKKVSPLIIIYLFFSLLFFYFIALDVLHGKLTFQFYADSITYEDVAIYGESRGNLTEVGHNTFGPVTILHILGPKNYFLIYLFNIGLFLLSICFFSKNKEVSIGPLVGLIMIQPITFTSLMSINKEIIALLCTALIIYNHNRNNKWIIPILIVLTYFVRWQFTLFYLLYLFIFSKYNPLKNKRGLTTILLLLGITAVLFVVRNTFLGDVFAVYDNFTERNDAHGSGIFRQIMMVQDHYGYIVAFIPKVLLYLVGALKNYPLLFDFSDAYNNTIVFLQTVFYSYILIRCFKSKAYTLKSDYFYIALIYCILFSISPIFAPRYYYPAIIFLCYELSLKKQIVRY